MRTIDLLQLQDAANALGNAASLAQSLPSSQFSSAVETCPRASGGAQNSECNARMIDMPYGLNNPEAAERSALGAEDLLATRLIGAQTV